MANPINGSPEFDPMVSRRPAESGGTKDSVREVKENVQKAAAKAQRKAARMADEVVAKVDEKRESAAEAMSGAADTLHRVAGSGGKAVQAAYAAGRQLEETADFLHQHDVRGSLGEAERFVKSHPTESLIAAAVVGFLVGRVIRRI